MKDLSAHLVAQCLRASSYGTFAGWAALVDAIDTLKSDRPFRCFGMDVPKEVLLEAMLIYPLPRSTVDRQRRAEGYLEWRRKILRQRWKRRLAVAAVCLTLPPAALIVLAVLWRGAVFLVVS